MSEKKEDKKIYSSAKILQNQLEELKKHPVEGFAVELKDESNIYEWRVYIEGPPGTDYENGIFQGIMTFPQDYPFSPPSLKLTSQFWHPNVYKDGKVCISILHPPVNDPMSGERPEERWTPAQTPETILLSIISMLSDPNISSPANVDASVEWRKDREAYQKRVKALVEKSLKELPKDFVMPYKLKKQENVKRPPTPGMDFYDDDVYEYDPDADSSDEDYGEDDGEGEDEEEEEEN